MRQFLAISLFVFLPQGFAPESFANESQPTVLEEQPVITTTQELTDLAAFPAEPDRSPAVLGPPSDAPVARAPGEGTASLLDDGSSSASADPIRD